MPPKVRDVIRRLEREGWEHIRTRGSHRTFKHPERPDIVTIAGHRNDELQAGTWSNIQEQAGWKQEPPQ